MDRLNKHQTTFNAVLVVDLLAVDTIPRHYG